MRYAGWVKEEVEMTSELRGWVIGNIKKFSKKVTSTEIKYQCVLGE